MLKSFIQSVTNIKYELKDITTTIDRIEERQRNIMLLYNNISGGNVLHTNNSVDETWNFPDFPLTSFKELDSFEQKLLDDDYKLKLVKI